jgi:hypothetical protein
VRLANPTLPNHKAAALPARFALAATWDPDLAQQYGGVMGAEAAATGTTSCSARQSILRTHRSAGARLKRSAKTRCYRHAWLPRRSKRCICAVEETRRLGARAAGTGRAEVRHRDARPPVILERGPPTLGDCERQLHDTGRRFLAGYSTNSSFPSPLAQRE